MIKPKKKICKGNYRSDYFEGCGELKYIHKYGLCRSCFNNWIVSTEKGKEFLRGQIIPKAKKDVRQKKKAEKKKAKEKLKTLGDYKKEARRVFQKYIRERDKDLPCISCGNYSDLVDAGHYFKAETHTGLIFDERNCHSQCRRCNRYLGGNLIEYRKGLVKRKGEDFVKQLEADADELRLKKYTREDYIEIKNKYK